MSANDKKAEAAAASGGAIGGAKIDEAAAKRPLRDGIDTVRTHIADAAHVAQDASASTIDRARDGIGQARDKAADALSTGKEKALGAYATGREKASEAYQAAFDRAKSASQSAADGIEANPIVTLAGGIALGVVIGALLPRTEREGQLYGAIGGQIGDLAKEATGAAKDAGRTKLADLGVSQDKGRDLFKTLIDAALQAAVAAGGAALESAKAKRAAEKG